MATNAQNRRAAALFNKSPQPTGISPMNPTNHTPIARRLG